MRARCRISGNTTSLWYISTKLTFSLLKSALDSVFNLICWVNIIIIVLYLHWLVSLKMHCFSFFLLLLVFFLFFFFDLLTYKKIVTYCFFFCIWKLTLISFFKFVFISKSTKIYYNNKYFNSNNNNTNDNNNKKIIITIM